MYEIELVEEESNKTLLEYKSSILPIIGDDFAGAVFDDGKMRTVKSRLIFPQVNNHICIYLSIKHPNLYK